MPAPRVAELLLNGNRIPSVRNYGQTIPSLPEMLLSQAGEIFPGYYVSRFELALYRDLEETAVVDLALVSQDYSAWHLLFVAPTRTADLEYLRAKLRIALDSPLFSRFGPPPLAPQGLFALATLVVALWEFLFPLLIWWNRTRRPALAMGVALHSSILVFMNIGVFPLAMLALYPALLLPEECKVLIGRWPSGRGWKMTRSRLKVENPELSRSTCHLSFRLPASSHRDELRASIIGRGR